MLLALCAIETAPDLRAHANTVAFLHRGDLGAGLEDFADDFVADHERRFDVAPAAGDGVQIAAADAAGLDADVDVVFIKFLGFILERVRHGLGE